jgi:hypothetical protein
MTASESDLLNASRSLGDAITCAIGVIAPAWPLDRLIAVNPYWGLVGTSFDETARTLARLAGSPMVMPVDYYLVAWKQGDIAKADLDQAIAETGAPITPQQLVDALEGDSFQPQPPPLLSDQIDRRRDLTTRPSWCDSITHQISQFCAAYFDRQQADWHPVQSESLYMSWRSAISKDHSIHLLMGESRVPERSRKLADKPVDQILRSLRQLQVPEKDWSGFLQTVILRVSGWASWCAYLKWQQQLEGSDHDALVDLLAIRLSWETLLDDDDRGSGSVWSAWMSDWQKHDGSAGERALELHLVWQRAQEVAYQRHLANTLLTGPAGLSDGVPAVQAAFCIDVRSEVFRRHFEAQSVGVETIGFAGFFGLPVSYAPLGTSADRPQLPGLLAPQLHITDSSGDAGSDARIAGHRRRRLNASLNWQTFTTVPLSSFSLVESLGLGYVVKLARRTLPGLGSRFCTDRAGLSASENKRLKPSLTSVSGLSVADLTDIAANVLTSMGLASRFARVVLLVGHGCQTANNPHQAGLECGACCGQTGEVNARALAGLLNDPLVRDGLREKGIAIPDFTHFIAGFHNTTVDEISLFNLDELPDTHLADLRIIEKQLQAAGASARAERAVALGLGQLREKPVRLHRELLKRSNDWSQTRPEWGLANNAAFIIAPRSRTRGKNLNGRAFLHEYDHRSDQDGALLEQIMTAPMIVAHWINMQYYGSTVDNRRYGSGNKLLHNVVGGRIGVFEGNGGDLRIGLPWQSIHNGAEWQHTPLRLTVVIDAPTSWIEAVIERHEIVRQLVENRWLYLFRLDEAGLERIGEQTS